MSIRFGKGYKCFLPLAAVLVLAISGCAHTSTNSQGSYPQSIYSAHTGVYSISATSYNDLKRQVKRDCPYGYQQIDFDHEEPFDWHTTIVCKRAPEVNAATHQ